MSVHGTSSFVLVDHEVGWNQARGAFEVYTYEGPLSAISEIIASVAAGYTDYSRTGDGELVQVKFSYALSQADGIGSVESDTGLVRLEWELEGNDIEKSLWEHPKVIAVTSGYDASQLTTLRQQVNDIIDGTATSSPANADLATMAEKLAAGIEAFGVSQYVLRKTQLVRVGTSLRPSHHGTNTYLTYAQLLGAEPSLADENLVAAADLSGLQWLKRTPTTRPTQDGLWEIVQEYWGAEEWDSWIYDAYTAPS